MQFLKLFQTQDGVTDVFHIHQILKTKDLGRKPLLS